MLERVNLQTASGPGQRSAGGAETGTPVAPTVFVVEDDAVLRDSLRWLIASVGLTPECFPTAEHFLAAYDPDRSGCLVVDIRLPGMSGIALQAVLKERGIALPLIVITAYAEVSTVVKTITEGAIDFFEKPFSDELLLDSIRKAIDLDRRLRDERRARAGVRARLATLTPREREILALITKGRASKMIASELRISAKTVEAHRSRLMRKLEVDSIAELIRLGLVGES